MTIPTLSFSGENELRQFSKEVWGVLTDEIITIKYSTNFEPNNPISWEQWRGIAESLKSDNHEFLNSVHNHVGVYGIFTRDTSDTEWEIEYIGHSKGPKQRIINHLFKKHEKTGAKLAKVKKAIEQGKQVGVSFVGIKPAELRRYVEMMLINDLEPKWCIHGNTGSAEIKSSQKDTGSDKVKTRVVLIACVKTQLTTRAPANQLFISSLFRYSLRYAEMKSPDLIFILSAKYGLIELDEIIEPYDVKMSKKTAKDKKKWAGNVVNQIKKYCDPDKTEFEILAGKAYYQYLEPKLRNPIIPMRTYRIGERLQFLKNEI